MTQDLLNNDFKKWLTGEIGECWHELDWKPDSINFASAWKCKKCNDRFVMKSQRTFIDSWQDFGDVLMAAQKKELFWTWLDNEGGIIGTPDESGDYINLHFVNPETFFPAMQEWWEANVKEK